MLTTILLKNLQKEGFLLDQRQTHFVIAYSGGVDSTVLLHLMAKLREKYPLVLTAAYYHHGWREENIDEVGILHQNCQQTKIPLVIIPCDKTLPKTEGAAREARYKAFIHLAKDIDAQGILTGHQADDQVETLLFHLFRGTGIEGLSGIQKKLMFQQEGFFEGKIPVIRPLLDIFREGISRYAQLNQITFFEDPTNQDNHYQRNAIRNQLIPLIQERFPQAKSAILRLATLTAGDMEILQETLEPIWQRVQPTASDLKGLKGKKSNKVTTLDSLIFNQLSRPYQRWVMKRFLTENQMNIDFQTIEEMIDFIQGESRKNVSVGLKSLPQTEGSGNRFLSLYKNKFTLLDLGNTPLGPKSLASGDPTGPEPLTFQIPGQIYSPYFEGIFKILPIPQEHANLKILHRRAKAGDIIVDLISYKTRPFEIRSRRQGDRIQPLGMPVKMRLKRYLINKGIPRFERDKVPLLAFGNEILWAVGLGFSETIRLPEALTEDPTYF
ncbi:MAG: tRNA lysidine(34) synthetase TilS, partial [Cyanobacteria bacterium]|nr:tRNA lysidine(34) synthetase TilS [Cyanobacteriota bacterium]